MKTQGTRIFIRYISGLIAVAIVVLLYPIQSTHAAGASLKISPSTGTYEVGGLVDISMIVDTGGESINAVAATLQFPPDKLQVVNPAASTSFISVWVSAPTYSNTDGTVSFQGGLPNPGIKTSAGVITTITFRVKAPGKATLRFAPNGKVLRNDGNGTNILTATSTAELTFKVPPPAGPIVSSPTHTDQNSWYNNNQVQFVWDAVEGATGYSFIFDQSPKTIPDETVDTTTAAASEKANGDGIWFFHVRAKTVTWGGVTTYPVQIDTTPPASFTPKLGQNVLTTEDIGTLQYTTTDAASGIDHYEVKILARNQQQSGLNTLFIEAASPYSLPVLPAGEFNFIVRAVDRAGNAAEGTLTASVVSGGIPFFARVPLLRNPAIANTALLVLALLTIVFVTILIIRRLRLRTTFKHDLKLLEHDAQKKAAELQRELDELRDAQQIMQNPVIGMVPRSNAPNTPPPNV